MSRFDPKKARESGQGGVPAGDYLVAIRSFKRNESKKGKDYLVMQIAIIAGAAKTKRFRDLQSLDVDNETTAFRISLLLEACGHEGDIDLRNDDELHEAIINKPFKARVSRKLKDGYVNNGIERYLMRETTNDERETMERWMIERAEAAEADEDFGGAGSSDARDVPPPSDDDIPF